MNQHDTPAKVASTDGLGPLVEQAGWAVEMHGQCVLFAANAEKERGMSPGATTRVFTEAQVFEMLAAERERICAAIKAEDDHCADRDYMLDSDDCIAVARGTWKRPE